MRVLTCFKIVVGLALLATFSFFYSLLSVTEIPMREDYIEIPSLRYHIDTVNVGKRSVFISGWVLDKGHVVATDSSDSLTEPLAILLSSRNALHIISYFANQSFIPVNI